MEPKNSTRPVWYGADIPAVTYDKLAGDLDIEVAIIGAGITGLTTAWHLRRAGKKVAIFDLGKVGGGTTGANSGHLSSMADTWYYKIEDRLGEEEARLVAQSMQEAQFFVETACREGNIDCDFAWVPGYLYTERALDQNLLDKEAEAAAKAGLRVEKMSGTPLPFPVMGAVKFEQQAQFHPLKYVRGLAAALHGPDCLIFEDTIIRRVEEEGRILLETDSYRITADEVVMATHMPVSLHPVQSEVFAYISYCLAVRTPVELPDALFVDTADPYHYLRSLNTPEGRVVILGGNDHKTGHVRDTEACLTALEDFARDRFGAIEIVARWSGQYYHTADGLPFIGLSALLKHTYIATGFSGDGLTWGTVAGRLLADLVLDRENPYADLYSATRFNLLASARDIFRENVDAVRHLVSDRFSGADAHNIREVRPGEGKIVLAGGKKLAVYRNAEGRFFALSPLCHHLGCYVHWNNAEHTWDCPCHGSRFNAYGKVIYGPVLHDLDSKEIKLD